MTKKQKTRPQRSLWVQAATAAAVAASIDPERVLSRSREKAVTRARWAAWAAIVATGRYSVAGLAQVCGWDHSSILHGLKMLRRENALASATTVMRLDLPKPAGQPSEPPTVPGPAERRWQKADCIGRGHDSSHNFRTSSRSDALATWWPEFSAAKKHLLAVLGD